MSIQTAFEFQTVVDNAFPGAQVETDNDGQLIIYTGLKLDGEMVVEFDVEVVDHEYRT